MCPYVRDSPQISPRSVSTCYESELFPLTIPWIARISNAMSSITPPHAPTEAALEPLRDELKGNMLPNVHGFFAKYFEGKSWSTVTQNKFQETTSANMVGKLSARVTDLANLDVLVEWLAEFQTLFFGVDQANLRFCSQPLSNTSSTPKTAIYLETSDVQSAAGSTRVFGEFHLDSAPVMADDDDDDPALLRASTARVQGPVGSMLCPRVPRPWCHAGSLGF